MSNSAIGSRQRSGYSKLQRMVMKHRALWSDRPRVHPVMRVACKRDRSFAQFDLLVGAIGRGMAEVIYRRGFPHVRACIEDPARYMNDLKSRPA